MHQLIRFWLLIAQVGILRPMADHITIQIDKSHLSTIGERLYTQSLDLIRELVANAYDADATVVKITVDDTTIIVEDNGLGMNREGLQQYLTIGSSFKKQNPLSSVLKRQRIGEFGIGKFAVLSVCDRFEIFTQSNGYSATLIFDRRDFEARTDWNIPLVEHQHNTDTHGTRVSLFAIHKPISLFDIERHLIHVFPLTTKDFSVYLNGAKVSSKFIPGQRFKVKETTRFGLIHGEVIISSLILPKENMGVGIRVKGMLICRKTFGIELSHSVSTRKLTGEINADFLPITASRNDCITDTPQYEEFEKLMEKNLRKVIKILKKSAESYQDKKAEQTLSDALLTIREALKKNRDILLLEGLPLFSRHKEKLVEQATIQSGPLATALQNRHSETSKANRSALSETLKTIKPKMRGRIKTLLRDDRRIVKKVKIGGNEFLVSFTHLGANEKESFTEGGIIFINRDHPSFKKTEGKTELTLYHLIRLITQEIIKLTEPKDIEAAFDWQGKLIKDALAQMKNN